MDLKKDLIKKSKKENATKTKKKYEPSYNEANAEKTNTIESRIIESRMNRLFVEMRNVEHLDEVRTGLHASAIITSDNDFCYREQVLSLFYHQNQGKELSVGLLKIFAAGNSIHEKWQTMFEKSGILIKNEVRSFSAKYDLLFTPDSIVSLNGKDYVVEIKSMNTFAFQKAKSHPMGQKQCMLYMHLLGIPNGFVLVEDKNSQDIKVFPVEYDYQAVLPYLDRLNEVQELKKDFVENRVVPSRKCDDANCKRALECNMRDVCFGSREIRRELRLKNN